MKWSNRVFVVVAASAGVSALVGAAYSYMMMQQDEKQDVDGDKGDSDELQCLNGTNQRPGMSSSGMDPQSLDDVVDTENFALEEFSLNEDDDLLNDTEMIEFKNTSHLVYHNDSDSDSESDEEEEIVNLMEAKSGNGHLKEN